MRRRTVLGGLALGGLAAVAAIGAEEYRPWTRREPPDTAGSGYYVAPDGNDGSTGSRSNPWATLQHASDRVEPGETVHVQPGSYAGFHHTTDGTADDPITFRADGDVVVAEPNGQTADGINLEVVSHVIVEGFEVRDAGRAGIRAVGLPDDEARGVTLRNNACHGNATWGIFTGYAEGVLIEHNETTRSAAEHGIYVSNSADGAVIRGNVSWGNAASGLQLNADGSLPGDGVMTGALIERNVVSENGSDGGAGINADGVQDSAVRNNLLYDNHASGVALYRIDGSEGATDNLVVNNTVVNAADGRACVTVMGPSTDNTIVNNALVHRGHDPSVSVAAAARPGLSTGHNAVGGPLSLAGERLSLHEWRSETGLGDNSLTAAPADLFVAPDADDYRLAAGSPAIDAGTAAHGPTVDLDGNARPAGAGVDIGAYERQS